MLLVKRFCESMEHHIMITNRLSSNKSCPITRVIKEMGYIAQIKNCFSLLIFPRHITRVLSLPGNIFELGSGTGET